MKWSNKKYPEQMRFLPTIVRRKAIEVANSFFADGKKEQEAIKQAIAKALDWVKEKDLMQDYFQGKVYQGNCCLEIKHDGTSWVVNTSENEALISSKAFRNKSEAVNFAKNLGREIKYILFIYGLDNTLLQKIDFSYGKV